MKKGSQIKYHKTGDPRKRSCMLGTLIAALLLILLIVLGAMKLSAMPAKAGGLQDLREKAYRSVLVKPGDSLWRIAEREMGEEWIDIRNFIQEVRVINGISDDRLTAGAYLIIPYYTDT